SSRVRNDRLNRVFVVILILLGHEAAHTMQLFRRTSYTCPLFLVARGYGPALPSPVSSGLCQNRVLARHLVRTNGKNTDGFRKADTAPHNRSCRNRFGLVYLHRQVPAVWGYSLRCGSSWQ